MNILLTNILLNEFGGTESWIYTIAKELFNQGHEVTVYSPNMGSFGYNYLGFANLTREIPTENFDLILCNHLMTDIQGVKGFKVNNCHSFFIPVENFVEGADKYISISEEVKDIQSKRGFESEVIMNPIDFEKFYECPSKQLKRVLHFSKYNNSASRIISEVCDELGLEFSTIKYPTFETQEIIKDFDLVIGIGRCLMESMAMGKNVISGDKRDWMENFIGGGMITQENYNDLKYSNFSGRNNPIIFTKERLKEEIKKFSPNNNLREILKQDCDHKLIVDKYLRLCPTYTKNAI